MFDFKKKVDENDEQYIWRMCQYKDSGLSDMNWDEIADILNKELGNEDTPYHESAYRKPFQQAKRFYDAGVFGNMSAMDYSADIREQKHELEKEKIKVRDERNELRRIIREEARKESFVDQVKRAVSENIGHPLEYDNNKKFSGAMANDNDLVVTFYDVHAGMNVDNEFNVFNQDVLKNRINKYLDKIFEIQKRHGSENVYVVLSELLSGYIHPTIRIENNQNLIEQFLTVSDYIADFLEQLSYMFNNVNIYIAPGNHSRLTPNKDQSLRGENLDLLVMPYLEAKMQNFDNVHFFKNNVDEVIAVFDVRGQKVFAVHGDRTNMNNIVEKLSLYMQMVPNIIYTGHYHTNAMKTSYDVKILQAGSFAGGGDEFVMDKMLRGKPEQIISVVNNDGIDCNYDVRF